MLAEVFGKRPELGIKEKKMGIVGMTICHTVFTYK